MTDTLNLKKGKMSHPSGKKNSLNDLSGSEWAQSSKSVMEYPDKRSKKQKIHGASFPQSLAEHHIIMYTKKGELVLDPFVGVGTTLDACKATGRSGIGIELNSIFVELAKEDLLQDNLDGLTTRIIHDDANNLLSHLEEESVDMVITSPPYANLLKHVQKKFLYKWKKFGMKPVENAQPYSDDERDIGNLEYDICLDVLKNIFNLTYKVTKPSSYAVWIVKDFRNLQAGIPYVNLHSDIIQIAEEVGWTLWDIRIYDQTRFRPLVVLGIPSRRFYLNLGHSYVLVFRKGGDRKPND